MLMYGVGEDKVININFAGEGVIFNLSALREGFTNLNMLIPPNELGRFTDRDFDILYAKYIMENDNVFYEFFSIVYNLYIGRDVLILASAEDWSENILESLLKLIQQRYGYNAVKIDNDDDYIFARNNMTFGFAYGYGLYNLDIDKDRYSNLIEVYRIKYGRLPANAPDNWIPKECKFEAELDNIFANNF
jgi:hypothetical protein